MKGPNRFRLGPFLLLTQTSMAAMLAERIRSDHLTAGQREAERILGEAALQRDSVLAEGQRALEKTQSQAAALIASAQAEGELANAEARGCRV